VSDFVARFGKITHGVPHGYLAGWFRWREHSISLEISLRFRIFDWHQDVVRPSSTLSPVKVQMNASAATSISERPESRLQLLFSRHLLFLLIGDLFRFELARLAPGALRLGVFRGLTRGAVECLLASPVAAFYVHSILIR
jgi:hypothetical protein